MDFFRRSVTKEDKSKQPDYASKRCIKLLRDFSVHDVEEFENMRQFSAELIRKAPMDYAKQSILSRGLLKVASIYLFASFSQEDLLRKFLKFYFSFDVNGDFKLQKSEMEWCLEQLAKKENIGKEKMMKAVRRMCGKTLIGAFNFLKNSDKPKLLDEELAERLFQSLTEEGKSSEDKSIDWLKFLPFIFAFFIHCEADQLYACNREMAAVIGTPERLTEDGCLELDPERPLSHMSELFAPLIPMDGTKIALSAKEMLEFQMSIPFLRVRHVSEVLKAYRTRSDNPQAVNFTMDDIENICWKLKKRMGISSVISDQMGKSLAEVMPWLSAEVVLAKRLRTLKKKGILNRIVEKDEQIRVHFSVNVNFLLESQLAESLYTQMQSLSQDILTSSDLFRLANDHLTSLLPVYHSSFSDQLQSQVTELCSFNGAEVELRCTRDTAKVAAKAILQASEAELANFFRFLTRKHEAGMSARAMIKEIPTQTTETESSQASSRASPKAHGLLFTNRFLQEARRKQILIQIARIYVGKPRAVRTKQVIDEDTIDFLALEMEANRHRAVKYHEKTVKLKSKEKKQAESSGYLVDSEGLLNLLNSNMMMTKDVREMKISLDREKMRLTDKKITEILERRRITSQPPPKVKGGNKRRYDDPEYRSTQALRDLARQYEKEAEKERKPIKDRACAMCEAF